MKLIEHEEFGSIRTVSIKKEPWFVAKDVCAVLDLSDTSMSVRRLDEDEKGIRSICTPGGKQEMIVVNESGFYSLVFASRKPEAKKFRKWVTSKVLPSIRKYGFYSTDLNKVLRANRRLEEKFVKTMLGELSKNISDSDIGIVSRRCKVSVKHVENVLRGYKRDVYLVSQLYARATGNRELSSTFYSLKGAEELTEYLRSK